MTNYYLVKCVQQLKNNKVYEKNYSFDDKGTGGLRWGEEFVVTSFKFFVRISVAMESILTTFLHMQTIMWR